MKMLGQAHDRSIARAAANVKDATELMEAGYEYVCDVDDVKLFKKRKRVYGFIESMDVC